MPIAITTTATYIKSVPGVNSKDALIEIRSLRSIEGVMLYSGRKGTYVEMIFSSKEQWTFDMNNVRGADATVNGATPAGNEELTDALSAFII